MEELAWLAGQWELTLLSLQTSTDIFANSVDPDEMACYKPSHQDLHCLLFNFSFFDLHPYLHQLGWLNLKMEYSISETRG